MTEITLDLTDRKGTRRIMTLRANGTYKVRYDGEPPSNIHHDWDREMRGAYRQSSEAAHLVPLIDAAFEALRAEADDPKT